MGHLEKQTHSISQIRQLEMIDISLNFLISQYLVFFSGVTCGIAFYSLLKNQKPLIAYALIFISSLMLPILLFAITLLLKR